MIPLVLALKDLRLLLRDRVALFWAIGFPLLFAGLFGAVLSRAIDGRPAQVAIAFDDQDASPTSIALGKALAEHPDVTLTTTSSADAHERVLAGAAVVALHLPKGFGAASPMDPKTHPQRVIVLEIDPSRRPEAAFVQLVLLNAIAARAPPGCAGPEIESRAVATSERTPGYLIAFPAAVLWGLIGCAGSFASAMVTERRSGTFLRLRAAPISPSALLGGKVLACFIACTSDALILCIVARLALGIRLDHPALLAIAIASCAACFAGLTVLLGSIGKSEQAVSGAAWATLLLLAMIGGAMVPSSLMPKALRAIGALSPIRWGMTALEGATFRASTPRALLTSCGLLLSLGLLSYIGATALARRAT